MSGPKVVRIVTREELLARSQAIAARLDVAVRRWEAAAKAAGGVSDEELRHGQETQARWMQELAADRFTVFNDGANREIAYLKADAERRTEIAVERRASARLAHQRAQQNASVLLRSLQEKKVVVDPAVRRTLEEVSKGQHDMSSAERALAAGFRLLSAGLVSSSSATIASLTDAQRGLANQLAEGAFDSSFTDWKAVVSRTTQPADDPRLQMIAQQLETLVLLNCDTAVLAAFEARLDSCTRGDADAQRSMKLDTLAIDLARTTQERKDFDALANEAAGVLAELRRADSERSMAIRQLTEALESGDAASLRPELKIAKGVVEDLEMAGAARARRSAVLEGLAKLGYAVNEGMETAWTDSGRIILQKPGVSDYGVELTGPKDAVRMQVRAVAFGAERNSERDTDAEQLWCGDFERLKGELAASGGSVQVERAMAVGEVPLKLVQRSSQTHNGSSTRVRKAAGASGI